MLFSWQIVKLPVLCKSLSKGVETNTEPKGTGTHQNQLRGPHQHHREADEAGRHSWDSSEDSWLRFFDKIQLFPGKPVSWA